MSIDNYKKRKTTQKQSIKTKRTLSARARRLLKIRSSSHCQRIKGISLSDNGSKVYITQSKVPNGKIVGHISKNGRIYNIVVVPPIPDSAPDYDEVEKKKKKKGESKA